MSRSRQPDPATATPDVIVAGGGPAGLAAAFRLQQAGRRVRVLDAATRAGSKMASVERDGFVLDAGAIFLPSTYRHLLGLAEDAGLSGNLVEGGFTFGFVRDRQVHHLDATRPIRAFLRLGALSPRAKAECIRLAPELLRSRAATVERIEDAARYDTGTLADWANTALTPEVRERLISPAIRAIFAAEPDQVSRVEFLGIIQLFAGARLLAFRGGMAQYADGVAAQLDVRTGAEVGEVRQMQGGARVTWRDADGEHTDDVAGCVVALPGQTAAEVRSDLDGWRAERLRGIRQGAIITPNIALSRAPVGLDAAYTMVPRREHPHLGGFGSDHLKAPGRAPDGKGLLTLTLVTDWCERHFEDDDERLQQLALEAIEPLLPGTADAAEFVQINRWRQQYSPVGHYADLPEFRARTARLDRTVHLAGEYLYAPNLNAATASGEAAAAALLHTLKATAGDDRPPNRPTRRGIAAQPA